MICQKSQISLALWPHFQIQPVQPSSWSPCTSEVHLRLDESTSEGGWRFQLQFFLANDHWLVVEPTLWKIWKSVGIITPNRRKNKKCPKPPTKYFFCHATPILFGFWVDTTLLERPENGQIRISKKKTEPCSQVQQPNLWWVILGYPWLLGLTCMLQMEGFDEDHAVRYWFTPCQQNAPGDHTWPFKMMA